MVRQGHVTRMKYSIPRSTSHLPVGFKEILNIHLVFLVWIYLLQGGAGGVVPDLLQPKIKRQPDFLFAVPTIKNETHSSHSCHRKVPLFVSHSLVGIMRPDERFSTQLTIRHPIITPINLPCLYCQFLGPITPIGQRPVKNCPQCQYRDVVQVSAPTRALSRSRTGSCNNFQLK